MNESPNNLLGAGAFRMDRSHDERALRLIDMIHHTLRPRKQRPFFSDILLRRLAHYPGQRDLLFLGDGFEGLIKIVRETDGCAYGCRALSLCLPRICLFRLHAARPLALVHHITPQR